MIILSKEEYKLVKDKKDNMLFHVQYVGLQKQICPCCMGELKIRDTRRRIMRKCQNEILWIQIHRMKCKRCSRLHNELPDCVIPQKHYSFDVVKEAVSKHIAEEKSFVDVENSTINRWHKWFMKVQAEVERIVHKVKFEKYNKVIWNCLLSHDKTHIMK